MKTIKHTMVTTGPLHHGSDKKAGTLKQFRRLRVASPVGKEIKIQAFPLSLRREIVAYILYRVYKSIDFKSMSNQRSKERWSEWQHKLWAALSSRNKIEFIERICRAWEIDTISTFSNLDSDGQDFVILECLHQIDDNEFLQTIRDESQWLTLRVKQMKEMEKAGLLLSPLPFRPMEKVEMIVDSNDIPCVSGNSIRGKIRDLVMYDFIERTGIEIMDKPIYHILLSGGALNDSTQYEDIDLRLKLINMCPMLDLLGAAIGKMTIDGRLNVSFAFPECVELGTGGRSFWNLLDIVFQTRSDDSKQEREIELRENGDGEPQQMMYQYEVLIPGTRLNHGFMLKHCDELTESCFYNALQAFCDYPYIGGMAATGSGLVNVDELKSQIDETKLKLYRDYLEKNKKEIKAYFENVRL